MKGKKKAIEILDSPEETAGDADVGNDESEWQDYNPVNFGPDVDVSASADRGPSTVSGPSSCENNAVMESTSTSSGGDRQLTPVTIVDDESDLVMSNLLSLSSQHSFSNLNIDNPYSASADFGFDF